MRPLWIGLLAILLLGSCARSPAPVIVPVRSSPAARSAVINPANIKRVARELPPGYEVGSDVPEGAPPRALWHLGAGATATPARCATLADPGDGRDQFAQGVSGSGAGGIVNAVVVSVPSGPVIVDDSVVAECAQWTMSDESTRANVELVEAPRIEGARTLGMVARVRTPVEAGTEIDSQTYTFTAYLGGYYAFTAVTTDPGSVLPPLPPQFAADLLVKTVAMLRS